MFMRNDRLRNKALLFAATAAVAGLMTWSSARAATGTWTLLSSGNASGTWSTATNWAGSTIADGAGFTADFSTLNITATSTVTLDSSRSIGTLIFQDKTTASNNWALANSNSAVLTLDNGANVPVIDVLNQTLTITAPLAGTNGFQKIDAGALVLNDANTGLSGTVTLLRGNITASNNSAFGSGPITINPGTVNNLELFLTTGINLPNNIVINSSNSGAGTTGTLITNAAFNSTFSGTITINAVATSAGHIAGSTGTNFLAFTNTITDSLPANFTLGGSGNGIVVRAGNIKLSGGGSYFRIDERSGTLFVGANNGVATNAFVNLGGNGNGILDLNGFNQSIVGVAALIGSNTNSVTNSSITAASTLTLTPNPSSYSGAFSGAVNFTSLVFSGLISDSSATFPLSIVVNSALNPNSGDNTGTQVISGTANTYRGTTTVTSGTLSVATLAAGGSNSSIGSSSNAATNLVLDGGTLLYTGGSVSTDRSFTITAGKIGTISVGTAASTLTISGTSAVTTGGLTKAGPGTLLLSGINGHTGPTSISAGTLLVNGSLDPASAVAVAGGAVFGGAGTAGGVVTPASGATIAPGTPAVASGVGVLSVGGLILSSGVVLNMEVLAGNDQVTVTNAGGLTINGGGVNLFNAGGVTPFSTNGTYTLFNYNSGFSGLTGNLTILNAQAGKSYSIANTATTIDLTIGTATTIEWDGALSSDWNDGTNWIGGNVPNAVGVTAKFNSNLSGNAITTVSPNGNKTVSGIIFDNASVSYDIINTGTVILDNGVGAAAINVNNGSHIIDAPLQLNGTSSITTANALAALTINGNISGAKPLSISGPGTVTLTGTNGYTTTSLTGGTLNVGASGGGPTGSLGSGSMTMSGSAILNFNLSTPYNFAGGISGAGSINQVGLGTVSVAGVISGVTTVSVSNGALVASNGLGQSGGVSVTGAASLTVNGGLTGAGALVVNTSGTVSLGGANSYGKTTLTAGTIALQAASTLAAGTTWEIDGGVMDLHGNSVSLSNITDLPSSTGVVTNNAASSTTSTVNFAGNSANFDMYAALNDGINGGKVALTSNIANTVSTSSFVLHMHSAGTYSGGTNVTAQSIEADVTNALGLGPITLAANPSSINSERLQVLGGVTLPNAIIIGQGNPGVALGVIDYVTSSTGNATINGPVTIQADNVNGGIFSGPGTATTDLLVVNGAVNTTGTATTVTVVSGNVRFAGGGSYPNLTIGSSLAANASLGADSGISTGAVVTLGNGTVANLDLNGFNQQLAGILQNGTATITNSSTTLSRLTLTVLANDVYAGALTGNFALTKNSAGTVQLTGTTNSYSGGTTVNAGFLLLNNISGSATGTGDVDVVGPGNLGGAGLVSGGVTIENGAHLTPGATGVGSIGALTVGGLTLNSLAILDYDIDSPASMDQTDITSANGLIINGGKLNVTGASLTSGLMEEEGIYFLMAYNGNIGGTGVSALSLNPAVEDLANRSYTFGSSGGFVTLTVADVPEPASLLLLAAGTAGLMSRRRERARR